MCIRDSFRTDSILIDGVVVGITIVALIFNLLADNATPCAWFPALDAITPLESSSLVSLDMRLNAPLNLNEKTG